VARLVAELHARLRVLEVVPNLGHFLHVEAPATIAARVARWLA
jgi:pimeloyl-ACP methyl ester carboxylesterase